MQTELQRQVGTPTPKAQDKQAGRQMEPRPPRALSEARQVLPRGSYFLGSVPQVTGLVDPPCPISPCALPKEKPA